MLDKLKELALRYEDLEAQLSDPAVYGDAARLRQINRERKELQNAAYVLLRGSEDKNEEVYEQMDLYVPCGHRAAVSLRSGSVGYAFWQE